MNHSGLISGDSSDCKRPYLSAEPATSAFRVGKNVRGKGLFRRLSFPARLSSHGARTGDTINQSHVLGTISRSMPAPTKSGSSRLPRTRSRSLVFARSRFLDSSVAASTSVTPIEGGVVRFRCISPCTTLYRARKIDANFLSRRKSRRRTQRYAGMFAPISRISEM